MPMDLAHAGIDRSGATRFAQRYSVIVNSVMSPSASGRTKFCRPVSNACARWLRLAVILFSLDPRVSSHSPGKGLHSLGVRPGMLLGKSFFELLGDVPQAVADVRRALAGESVTARVELFGFESRRSTHRCESGTAASRAWWRGDRHHRAAASRRGAAARRHSQPTLVQQARLESSAPRRRARSVRESALVEMLACETEAELLSRHLDRDVFKTPAPARVTSRDE